MLDIKRVLVGVDFSGGSDTALLRAVRIAKAYGAIVHAVHVIESLPRDGVQNPALEHREEIARGLRDRLHGAVEKAGLTLDEDALSTELRVGRAAKEMLDAAEEINADVIVVGHRGKGLLERTLLGSVASSLVRASTRPVVVARDVDAETRNSVLVAVDLQEEAGDVLRAGADWAKRTDADLHILYAWEVAGLADYHTAMSNLPARHFDVDVTNDSRRQLELLVEEALGADHGAALHVRPGTAAYEIVFAAERGHHDMIVIGCRGRSGISKLLLGNTAERVVAHAPCSALVVHI